MKYTFCIPVPRWLSCGLFCSACVDVGNFLGRLKTSCVGEKELPKNCMNLRKPLLPSKIYMKLNDELIIFFPMLSISGMATFRWHRIR